MLASRIITKLGVKHCFSDRRKARSSMRDTHGHGGVSALREKRTGLSGGRALLGSLCEDKLLMCSLELGNPVCFLDVGVIVDLQSLVDGRTLVLYGVLVG